MSSYLILFTPTIFPYHLWFFMLCLVHPHDISQPSISSCFVLFVPAIFPCHLWFSMLCLVHPHDISQPSMVFHALSCSPPQYFPAIYGFPCFVLFTPTIFPSHLWFSMLCLVHPHDISQPSMVFHALSCSPPQYFSAIYKFMLCPVHPHNISQPSISSCFVLFTPTIFPSHLWFSMLCLVHPHNISLPSMVFHALSCSSPRYFPAIYGFPCFVLFTPTIFPSHLWFSMLCLVHPHNISQPSMVFHALSCSPPQYFPAIYGFSCFVLFTPIFPSHLWFFMLCPVRPHDISQPSISSCFVLLTPTIFPSHL